MALAAVLLPLLGSVAIYAIGSGGARRRLAAALAAAEVLLTAAVAAWGRGEALVLFAPAPGLAFSLRPDALGCAFALLAAVVWLPVTVYAAPYMSHEGDERRFFTFFTATLGALVGACLAADMLSFYLFFEGVTLCSLPLVIHTRRAGSLPAGVQYLGYSVFGASLGLVGLFFLQSWCPEAAFTPGGVLPGAVPRETALVVAFLMLLGFSAKAGLFPLHPWLPTAHPVAPSPASAVLSGIITKSGVLAVLRLVFYVFGPDLLRGSWVQTVFLGLGLATVFLGSMLAYKEPILKRRLAYSSVSQLAYVLFGIFLLDAAGLTGALLQVLFHAFAKNALFLAAGMLLLAGVRRADEIRGTGKALPVTMWCFALASLSLIGIPPAGGFVSKWYLCLGALESGLGPLAWVGVAVLLVSAVLTAGYLLPLVRDAFFPGKGETPQLPQPVREGAATALPMCFFAGMTILPALALGPLGRFLSDLAGTLLPGM